MPKFAHKFSGSAQGFRKYSLRLSFPAEGGLLMLVTTVPRKWKRKDPEFKISLSYKVGSSLLSKRGECDNAHL